MRPVLLLLVGVVSLYLLFSSLVSLSWRSFAHFDWCWMGAARRPPLQSSTRAQPVHRLRKERYRQPKAPAVAFRDEGDSVCLPPCQ